MTTTDQKPPTLTNVSNPAALGVEWTTPGGSTCQLYTVRGQSTLYFATRTGLPGATWQSMTVSAPERFGFDPGSPPRSFRVFRAIADRFVSGES